MKLEEIRKIIKVHKDFYGTQKENARVKIPPATLRMLTTQPLTAADRYICNRVIEKAFESLLRYINESEVTE